MKLIKFSISKKKEIYLNPDKVTTVVPYTEDKTVINFVDSNSVIVVHHSLEYVVSKLRDDSDLDL